MSEPMESVEISIEDLQKADRKFEDDYRLLQMHRFPAGLRGLGDRYIIPMAVAIGPYHRRHASGGHLQKMEEVKHVAAFHLSTRWGDVVTPQQVYAAVLAVADDARKLYAAADGPEDKAADISDFAAMMFFDACFLLLYMEEVASSFKDQGIGSADDLLKRLLFSNRGCIDNDIMLLENQLPWKVVQAIINSLPTLRKQHYMQAVEMFIARMGNGFKIREGEEPAAPEEPQKNASFDFVWDDDGSRWPPHLLGLLRRYKTGEEGNRPTWPHDVREVSASSAIELTEIGVELTASDTALFTDMDVRESGALRGELHLAPLSLDDTRACCLVNMAALEVATHRSYSDDPHRSAVCSYLALFSIFMLREEDVHELRAKRILHSHRTNADMLAFFKDVVKHLPDTGFRFAYIMARIQEYKQRRRLRTRVHKFMYKNLGTIITVLTIVGTLVGIFQALLALNQSQSNHAPAGQYLSAYLPA